MRLLFSLLTCGSLLALLVAERSGSARGKWIAKPLASAGFVAAALAGGAAGSAYGRVMLAGFALSWLGDVLLIPKDRRSFVAGIGSFLLGHVAFGVAFARRGVGPEAVAAALLALALAGAAVLRWLFPRVRGGMRGAVVAYVAVISGMLALAAGGAARGHAGTCAGALAFYLSDLAVARNRFVAPGFVNRLWGLPLYYAAQLAFAWSV